jgi:hypothetical protein
MAFSEDIVNVTITLETTPVTVAGFGVPIFASEHRWFTERVRSYTSLTAVAADIPADSPEFAAATGYFNAGASPSLIKIGRRKVDLITFTPDAATAVGQVYTVDVTGTDDVTSNGTFTTITGSETPTVIATALVASLGVVTGVTITDTTGAFTVAATVPSVDDYTVGNISANITAVFTTTETAADMVAAIEIVDNDWYFISSNDHTAAFISTATTGMADTIEAREKLFFFSSQEQTSLATFDPSVTAASADVLGFMKVDQKFRTVGMFHHEADTTFPECYHISRFAPQNPGETTWTQKNIGISVSQDPSTNLALTSTQLTNVTDRNANFVQSQGGVAVVRTGVTSGGERIEIMRFRDFLVARITEAYQLKAINTEKIPYTDSGINGQRSVLESVLNRYVSTPDQPRGLQEAPAYTTSFPRRIDVPQADILSGTLNATFDAFLSGSILVTNISGTLSFETFS